MFGPSVTAPPSNEAGSPELGTAAEEEQPQEKMWTITISPDDLVTPRDITCAGAGQEVVAWPREGKGSMI